MQVSVEFNVVCGGLRVFFFFFFCVRAYVYVPDACGMIAGDSEREREKKRRHRNYSSEQSPIAIRDFVSQQLETHISVIS